MDSTLSTWQSVIGEAILATVGIVAELFFSRNVVEL